MKKLLILGAGIYQVPLIRTAQKLGIYTIVTSIPGNYPGFAIADKVYYENTVDYEAILRIAQEEKIDGVVTAGTDVAVITIGKICDTLGLTGLSFQAAQIACDKMLMKTCYEEAGVRTAKFRKIWFSDENYAEKLSELQMPLIFKSVDSSGSRGIMRVDSPAEFGKARQNVADFTRSDYFLVEEFIEGEEFGAQAFVQNGQVEFILPHGDYVFHGDTGVPIGHFAPYDLAPEVIEDAKVQLRGAIRAMGLNNCAVNADFILRNGQTYVLELGGRSGATCLAEMTSIYFGWDYYEKIIRVALGETVDFSSDQANPVACMLLRSDKAGTIISQQDTNKPDPDIVEVQFDYPAGAPVNKYRIGPDRIGHVVTRGETLEAAVAKLHEALEKIRIDVE